jgi:hypothetical protein
MNQKKFLATPGITSKDREEVFLDGNTFFTNEKLRQKVIHSAKKLLPTTQSTKIERLINDKKIIPLFMTKNLWDYFKNRYKHEMYHDVVRGLIHKDSSVIYIIMDNMIMKGGIVSEKLLNEVILHELVHLAFNLNLKKWLGINLMLLTAYYKQLYSIIFSIPKNADMTKAIQHIILVFIKHEKNRTTKYREVSEALDGLSKYSTLDIKEFDRIATGYIDFISLLLEKKSRQAKEKYPEIDSSFGKAFTNAFGVLDHSSNPVYRSYACSEVIATMAMVKPKSKFITQTIMIV